MTTNRVTRKDRTMFDVFDPRDGRTIHTYRYEWQARLATRLVRGLDYAPTGEGWI